MDQNVLSMSRGMQEVMQSVLIDNNDTSSFMALDVTFRTSEDASFAMTFDTIRSMTIAQDFLDMYTDVIDLELDLSPVEYEEIYEHSKGLFCEVIGRRVDQGSNSFADKIIFRFIGRAIWRDKRDPKQMYPTADMQVKDDSSEQALQEKHYGSSLVAGFQLIEAIAYDLRHVKTTMILKGATMEDALHFSVEQMLGSYLSSSEIVIVSPDNKKTYTNLVIQPMQDVSSLFMYLQQKPGYGIYNDGITYYYTGGVFYVYPPYRISRSLTEEPAVHFYYVGKNKLSGGKGYSKLTEDGTLHIVSDQPISVTDTSDASIETLGNALILMNTETLIDQYRTTVEEGTQQKVMVNQGTRTQLNILSDHGIADLAYNPRYFENEGNPYSKMAVINEALRIQVVGAWQHAVPFSITPTSRVYYHYDDDAKYTVRPGLCHAIQYNIIRTKRVERQLYACTAKLVLSISSRK